MSERLTLERKQYDFKSGILNEDEYFNFENPSYYVKDRQRLLEGAKTYFQDSGKYLGSVLHDSAVLSIEYKKNSHMTITFGDIRYDCFCSALKDVEGINFPCRKQVFSITLEFYGLKRCLSHWCNRNNKLLPLKTEKYIHKVDEFLYDEIQEVGKNYINLVFHLCTKMWKTPKYNLILHIIAESFSVTEKQQDVLHGLFERKYYPLLDAFQSEIEKGEFFDYSLSEEFIKKNRRLIAD
jgi:hypothetical protein